MSVPTIDAIDPNATLISSKQLAVVVLRSNDVRKTMDPGALQPIVTSLERDVLEIEDQVSRVTVTTEEEFARAGALRAMVSKVSKSADEKRKHVGDPFRRATTAINELFAIYTDKLDTAKRTIETKQLAYNKQREVEARARAEAERKRVEDEAQALALQAAAAGASAATQEEILQAGIEVAADTEVKTPMVEAHGIKTNVQHPRSGLVVDATQLLLYLSARPDKINEFIDFKKSAINAFAKANISEVNDIFCGVQLVESDQIRNY